MPIASPLASLGQAIKKARSGEDSLRAVREVTNTWKKAVRTMTIQKNATMSKQLVLTANGSHDTLINSPDQEYNGITIGEIASMVDDPQAKPKADAAFIIPSTYRKHDGRSHAAQRERGEYWMLTIDIDEGNPTADLIEYALEGIIADATRLIYTSAGATADNMKWRVLIPLKSPLTGAEYVDAQLALFDLMDAEFGIQCDTSLSRTGQPIFLPNVPADKRDADGKPNFYIGKKHRGSCMIDPKESRIWANVEFRAKQAEIAEFKAGQERAARQAKREENRSQRGDDVDPVDEFNQRHSIADLLLKYGYEQQGRSDSYRSPQQSSGSFATKDFGTHWVSLSGSDAGSGLGQAKDGICWGDAFDLYVYHEHVNDFTKAVRTYAQELRPDAAKQRDTILQDAYKASDDLDDFEFIPDDDIDVSAGTDIPQQGGIIQPDKPKRPIFWARDAKPVLSSSYLIKGWLGAGQMSVVYGPSNVGKSFFCLDMAFCIAAGIEWQGSRVKGGTVLYLATEGGNAFHNRVVALRREYGIDDAALAVRPAPIDLLRPEADLADLIELCREVESESGQPIALIVIDTLSRAMAGGDENGPTDMTAFIANIDALREVTKAHNMIVHHSGKDSAKGARGHSSLRAATDTEIELEVEDNIRTATATKQRDLEPKSPIIFNFKIHTLGADEDGDDVTTCTIKPADPDDVEDAKLKKPKGANQIAVAAAYRQMKGESIGMPNTGGAGWPEPGKYWTIDETDFRNFAVGKLTAANPRDAYLTAVKALVSSGYMVQNEGYIWMTGKDGRVKS